MTQRVLDFYTKWEGIGLKVTFILVALQIIHLYWLTSNVVLPQLGIESVMIPDTILFAVIDYIEIPALISGIVFYVIYITQDKKNVIFLMLLILQVVHITWISDDVIFESFSSGIIDYPLALLWFSILIDYLELGVIWDLAKRLYKERIYGKIIDAKGSKNV